MLSAKAANRKDLSDKPVTMTHQHYRKIAEIIRTLEGGADVWRNRTAEVFANELASTNPRFDRARFLSACGV